MLGYKIRDIEIKPGLVLAPMSGVTCAAFRRLIKELNPGSVGLVVSEFISVEAMTRKVRRSLEMMKYYPEERPYAIQIFGYDPKRMADAAMMVQDSGADIIDINCGCPAPKVVRKGGGCELMRQPEHLAKIVREVKKVIQIPLTMKIRAGWDSESVNAMEVALMAEQEGVEALAIHGRTRAQMYRGLADWELVGQVANRLKIPVLGSGDVGDIKTAQERAVHGAAGFFIGRAAMYNPFVFSEIHHGVEHSLNKNSEEAINIVERYMQLLLEDSPPKVCIGKVKQLASQFGRGSTWRKEICTAMTLEEQSEIFKRIRGEINSPEHQNMIMNQKSDYTEANPGTELPLC